MYDHQWVRLRLENLLNSRKYVSTTYHVRVYKRDGRLRFKTLYEAPLPYARYKNRTCTVSQDDGENWRTIIFYLDNVHLKNETMLEIAQKICAAMGW